MVTVSRRVLLPLLAPIPVPTACCMLAPNSIQTGETPSFFLAAAAPAERLSPPVTWLDNFGRRLTTYFTKKYPAYDFSPYTQELDRIRGAVSPAHIFHELFYCNRRPAAATSLRPALSRRGSVLLQRIMPDEECGIVYPGSGTNPPTEGNRTRNCSERPNIRGRV
ncbi:MAG: hypothetical protein SGJ16_04875 [Nitrospirota bacterium]|nr:hypothetical protein [Nitrospirota bacterium]